MVQYFGNDGAISILWGQTARSYVYVAKQSPSWESRKKMVWHNFALRHNLPFSQHLIFDNSISWHISGKAKWGRDMFCRGRGSAFCMICRERGEESKTVLIAFWRPTFPTQENMFSLENFNSIGFESTCLYHISKIMNLQCFWKRQNSQDGFERKQFGLALPSHYS